YDERISGSQDGDTTDIVIIEHFPRVLRRQPQQTGAPGRVEHAAVGNVESLCRERLPHALPTHVLRIGRRGHQEEQPQEAGQGKTPPPAPRACMDHRYLVRMSFCVRIRTAPPASVTSARTT